MDGMISARRGSALVQRGSDAARGDSTPQLTHAQWIQKCRDRVRVRDKQPSVQRMRARAATDHRYLSEWVEEKPQVLFNVAEIKRQKDTKIKEELYGTKSKKQELTRRERVTQKLNDSVTELVNLAKGTHSSAVEVCMALERKYGKPREVNLSYLYGKSQNISNQSLYQALRVADKIIICDHELQNQTSSRHSQLKRQVISVIGVTQVKVKQRELYKIFVQARSTKQI